MTSSLRAMGWKPSVWLGQWYVCMLHHGSNCSLARAMDGRIMHCGIISSCQSAEIVKRSWACVHRGAALYQVPDLYLVYLLLQCTFSFSCLWLWLALWLAQRYVTVELVCSTVVDLAQWLICQTGPLKMTLIDYCYVWQCMLMAVFVSTSCKTDGVQLMMSLLFSLLSRSDTNSTGSCFSVIILKVSHYSVFCLRRGSTLVQSGTFIA